MRAEGLEVKEIGPLVGVSEMTVRRYMFDQPPRPHEARNPLFDPVRDGVPPVSVTASICGGPLPGRRDLVAANRPRKQTPSWSP